MNIERTMQFILEAQARAEVRAERQDLGAQRLKVRTEAMEKRLNKRMDAITRLLQQGMRMLVRTEARVEEFAISQKELAASQKDLASNLKELATAQKATDKSLNQLIKSMVRGRNGH